MNNRLHRAVQKTEAPPAQPVCMDDSDLEIEAAIEQLDATETEAFMLVTTDGEQFNHSWHAPEDFREDGVPVSQLLLASLLQSYAELTDEDVDTVASGAAWAAKAVFGDDGPDPETNGNSVE